MQGDVADQGHDPGTEDPAAQAGHQRADEAEERGGGGHGLGPTPVRAVRLLQGAPNGPAQCVQEQGTLWAGA